jgi:hypothetical protein
MSHVPPCSMLINDPHLTDVAVVHSITRIQNKPYSHPPLRRAFFVLPCTWLMFFLSAFGMFQLTTSQMDDTSGLGPLYLGCSDTELARLKAQNYSIDMLNPGNRYSQAPALYQRLSTTLTAYDMTASPGPSFYEILLCRVVLGRSEPLDDIKKEIPNFHPASPWPLVREPELTANVAAQLPLPQPINVPSGPQSNLTMLASLMSQNQSNNVQSGNLPSKHAVGSRPSLQNQSNMAELRRTPTSTNFTRAPGAKLIPLALPITHNSPPMPITQNPPPTSSLPTAPRSPPSYRYVTPTEPQVGLAIHSIYAGVRPPPSSNSISSLSFSIYTVSRRFGL